MTAEDVTATLEMALKAAGCDQATVVQKMDRLSSILKTFNEQFGTLFNDTDRVAKRIRDDIAPQVAADVAYQNAKENTPHTAHMAHGQALGKVMQHLIKDGTEVYNQFVENESFQRFVGDMVFGLTSESPTAPAGGTPGRHLATPDRCISKGLLPAPYPGPSPIIGRLLAIFAPNIGTKAAHIFQAVSDYFCMDF